jgi:hypothetical protein
MIEILPTELLLSHPPFTMIFLSFNIQGLKYNKKSFGSKCKKLKIIGIKFVKLKLET